MKDPEYEKSTMPGILIKPVAYEEFHATLELRTPSRVLTSAESDFG